MIKIYTDGSYKPSTNQGGYASIIIENDKIIQILQYGFKNTTNNRQELYGVLEGLKYFKTPKDIIIYSDSAYIVNNYNGNYVYNWFLEERNDKKNLDLWKQIIDLCKFHNVKFEWVKGHSTNQFNNLADLYSNISAIIINPKDDNV